MKNFTFLAILMIPTILIAQSDDYCPCMESSNPLVNVMNMMSSLDGISAENFVFQKNPTTSNLDFSQEQISRPNFSNEITSIEKEETTNLSGKTVKSKITVSKKKAKRMKSAKKNRGVRLKTKKKVKKYRGKCPSF